MDFHGLARRDLQALCKKNKIPANMTNLAMADALKALEIVEGIEEYLNPVESENAQSSIESPEKSVEMSPCVRRTAGRSTRRRNPVKDEPETLPSRTSTRRSTRKAVAGDEIEKGFSTQTPVMTATTRRRAPVSTVRRKVETQFDEEEIGKKKKIVPPTPAPMGTASRRKAVKEEGSTVRKVYSTRRSTRLAEKYMDTPKAEDEKMETVKHELFTGENLDKVLEISGVDMKTISEDEEKKEKLDIVLETEKEEKTEVEDPKFSSEAIDESEVPAGENTENQSSLSNEVQEIDGSHTMYVYEAENELQNEVKSDPNKDDMESSDDFPKMDEEKPDESENLSGETIANQSHLSNEIQKNDESHNICISEAENAVENGVDASSYKDMEADRDVDDSLESKDNEISCVAKYQNEAEKETESLTDDNMDSEVDERSCDDDSATETEEDLKNEMSMGSEVFSKSSSGVAKTELDVVKDFVTEEADIEFVDQSLTSVEQIELDLTENFETDEHADEVSLAAQESLEEVSSDDETHMTSPKQSEESIEILESEQTQQESDQVEGAFTQESLGEVSIDDEIHLTSPKHTEESVEMLESEQNKQDSEGDEDDVPMSALISTVDPVKDDIQAHSVDVVQSTPVKMPMKKTPRKTPTTLKWMADVADNKNIGGGSKFFILANEKVKTPNKTPKSAKKILTDISDNKENLDSGNKILSQTKDKVTKVKGNTNEQDLHHLSLRKLTKMFKEKLQITNQSSQNENNPKAAKETITSRPALQALPENQLVDEGQN